MNTVFADTSFYVALANPRDRHHDEAVKLAGETQRPVVTTEYVLVELGNWLSRTGDRESFLKLLDLISADSNATVIPGSHLLFTRGADLFRQRSDKNWSLTDCISFVVMEDERISEALTADRHFEQAGFTALLR